MYIHLNPDHRKSLLNRLSIIKILPVNKNNPIWHEFIGTEVPTLLVLGDYFFMYEMRENRRIFIRDSRINSIEDYKSRIESSGKEWYPLEFTYIPQSLAISSLDIIPILKIGDQTIQATLSSILQWDDFDHWNIIYYGTFKSFYKIDRLLPRFNIQVQKDSVYLLQRTDTSGNVVESYELPHKDQGNFMTDYTFIGKIKGPGTNTVLLIASGDEVGLAKAVKKITSPDFQNELETLIQGLLFDHPFYFEMILKTEGFRRTGFSHEIVYFRNTTDL